MDSSSCFPPTPPLTSYLPCDITDIRCCVIVTCLIWVKCSVPVSWIPASSRKLSPSCEKTGCGWMSNHSFSGARSWWVCRWWQFNWGGPNEGMGVGELGIAMEMRCTRLLSASSSFHWDYHQLVLWPHNKCDVCIYVPLHIPSPAGNRPILCSCSATGTAIPPTTDASRTRPSPPMLDRIPWKRSDEDWLWISIHWKFKFSHRYY